MLYQSTNPHGGDIYTDAIDLDFSSNTNPFGTPPAVLEAMRESLTQTEHYPDPFCREAIQAISTGEKVSPEYLILGNGAAELIYSFCTAVTPRKALIPAPSFSEYASALENIGCETIYHQLSKGKDFMVDESLLDAIDHNKPQAVFLCNPNNPTGRLIPAELLRKIASLCEISGIYLFLDECFLDLAHSELTMVPQVGSYPHLFILKALTKTYALAGIRIGYCISADSKLLKRISRTVQPWNVSTIAQAAAIQAVKEKAYLQETHKLLNAERNWLSTKLREIGAEVIPSEANFILFQFHPELDQKLRQKGIAIRNCANFTGLGTGWFRIAVRRHDENEKLILAIEKVMKEADR
jgi:threonine-phosphate decarboxylase